MIALVLPTGATGDLIQAIQDASIGVPLAAVALGQAESVRLIPRPADDTRIPVYGYPEAAAAALARAARYEAWRTGPHGQVPSFPGIRAADARTLVTGFLHGEPGGWLPAGKTADLLRCYGIGLVEPTPADSEEEAVRAAEAPAGPVQPVVTGGIEVTIGMTDDRMFGPLVVFGLGGTATEAAAGRAARLTPLTDTDAGALIRSVLAVPSLLAAADLDRLSELLLRVSRLADDLPEVTELDLNPVMVKPHGVFAMHARIKVARGRPHDPFLRKLR